MNLIHHTQSTRNNEQIHYSVSRSKTSQPGEHARTHALSPVVRTHAHTHTSASTAWKSPYYHCNMRNHGAFQMFDMNNPSTLNKWSFLLAGAINQPHSGCRESSWEILLTRCDKTRLLFNALSEQWVSTKGAAWDSSLGSLGVPASPRGAGRISELKGNVTWSRLDSFFYIMNLWDLLLENATCMSFDIINDPFLFTFPSLRHNLSYFSIFFQFLLSYIFNM